MTCTCDQLAWPPVLDIPAGLTDLPRQLATFAMLRERMLARAALQPALVHWRGRDRDDYGLMLLELWAYVGELLAIYDQAIADESYVRTAKLRPSLRRIVAALGYVPRPAVAASAEVALIADGTQPLALPVGTSVRSGSFGAEKPQVFELLARTQIHPALDRWAIATPTEPAMHGAVSQLLLDPRTSQVAIGDTVLVELGGQRAVRVVSAVDRLVDASGRRIVQVRLDRAIDAGVAAPVATARVRKATRRCGLKTPSGIGGQPASFVPGAQLTLDAVYRDLHAGEPLLLERRGEQRCFDVAVRTDEYLLLSTGTSTTMTFSDSSTVTSPAQPVTGLYTVVSIGPVGSDWDGETDPAAFTVHFALEDAGRVLGAAKPTLAPTDPLQAIGTRQPLSSAPETARIALVDVENRAAVIAATIDLASGAIAPGGGETWSPLATPVTGYGNVVTIGRGQTIAQEILGDGDATQASQAFTLKQSPLTYLAAPGNERGVASTLQIWVDGLAWSEVPTLYGQSDKARVFVIRQDDTGASTVTFGDGVRGARLPTGSGNVIASYRYGAGAAAPPAGSLTQLAKPVPGLSSVIAPLAAGGGADAEPAASLAALAPRSALLLGRAISIDDMEAAARGTSGAIAARAAWAWDGVRQRPVVEVWVLGDAPTLANVHARLLALSEPNTPISAVQATPVFVSLAIDLELDPARVAATVLDGARAVLADALSPATLGIGAPVFHSQLVAMLSSLPGVLGVRALTWNGQPFHRYGLTPGTGAYFALLDGLVVTGELIMANDRYEQYFTEKLWELVPGIHRQEDGLAEQPGTLRAFISLIAEQAALLRRSHDRLWDDAFVDLCDDWAVPYIGDLVATRMVSALDSRARRVDVAKTIYYRRRKGTPRVLEELIADITGWEGKVVESFRFLGRFMHRLDQPVADRVDPSPGWADLRSPRLAGQAAGPWDPFAHTPDLRKTGRWNIPKVSFHLFRLAALPLRGVQPKVRADGKTFTFDPSGREIQLFMPRLRDDDFAWANWQSALPWQVPAPMACRTLGHAEYAISEALRAQLLANGTSPAAVAELAPASGVRFASAHDLRAWLAARVHAAELLSAGDWDAIRAGAIVADCGKAALWPDAVSVEPSGGIPIRRERASAASLADWSLTAPDLDVLVDPVRGRIALATAPATPAKTRVEYVYGFGSFGAAGSIGAGGYDRGVGNAAIDLASSPIDSAAFPATGSLGVVDSATYAITGTPPAIVDLVLQAANRERPYLVLASDWVLTGAGGSLVLDGLWLGASAPASLVLRGTWKQVTVRHATLDPGGTDVDGATLPPVTLWIEGEVDALAIEASIVSAIGVRAGGELDQLTITDTIVHGEVAFSPGNLAMQRTTVLGALAVDRLDASDCLCTELVTVTDTGNGCFRFSAAPSGSTLPHPYRWVRWQGETAFGSTRFGDARYAWLADSAPAELKTGGEGGLELGAWNRAHVPIKEESLLHKVEEYLPFGLIPLFIRET